MRVCVCVCVLFPSVVPHGASLQQASQPGCETRQKSVWFTKKAPVDSLWNQIWVYMAAVRRCWMQMRVLKWERIVWTSMLQRLQGDYAETVPGKYWKSCRERQKGSTCTGNAASCSMKRTTHVYMQQYVGFLKPNKETEWRDNSLPATVLASIPVPYICRTNQISHNFDIFLLPFSHFY